MRRLAPLLAAGGLAFALAGSSEPARAELVVIVHASNPVPSLSLRDVERIYRAIRTRWSDGTPIQPYLPPRGSAASLALATRVFRLQSEVAVARYYLRAIFEQRIARPPPRSSGSADAVRLVSSDAGGLAIVERNEVDESRGVRILAVEGL
jgi:ABC-type phosphate transport system substrate-binding protein